MRKLFKIVAVLVVVGVVLVAGAAVALRIAFPPAKLRALVIAEGEKALHRKLEVGDVSLGLMSGLTLSSMRLSEKPDFSAGEFVKADAFTLRFELWPLLRKRAVIRELRLDGLRAHIVLERDGRYNFQDLMGASGGAASSSASPGPAAALPVALLIDSVRVTGGLVYEDRIARAKSTVGDLDASIKNVRLSGVFPVKAKARLGYQSGPSSYEALVRAEGTVDLANLDLAKVSGSFPKLDADVKGIAVSGQVGFTGAVTNEVEGSLKIAALDSEKLGRAAGAPVPDGLRIPESSLAFKLVFSSPTLDVSSFEWSTRGLDAKGRLRVANLFAKDMPIELSVGGAAELGPVAAMHPLGRVKGLDGAASFKARAAGTVGAPSGELSAEATLGAMSSETLQALVPGAAGKPSPLFGFRLPETKAKLQAAYARGAVDIQSSELSLAGMVARTRGRVEGLAGKEPSFSLAVETDRFALAPLAELADAAKGLAVQGRASLKAQLSGTPSRPRAQGTIDFDGAGAAYMKQRLEGFTGSIRFTEDSVDLPALAGRVNGGDLKLKLSARNAKAPVVEVQGSLSVLDAGALSVLVPPAAPAPAGPKAKPAPYNGPVLRTSGRFSIGRVAHPNFQASKADLSWDLSGVTPELKLLDGKASFSLGEGKASNLLALLEQRKTMKALLFPLLAIEKARSANIPGVRLPSINDLPFTKVVGDYAFRKGLMTMQPFLMDSPDLYVETRGEVDLPGETVNLRTNTKVGGASIDLLVKGPFASPSVAPDLSKVVHQATEKAKEQLQQQLEEKGKELLKGLFR